MPESGVSRAIDALSTRMDKGFDTVYSKLDGALAKQNEHEKEDAREIATLKNEVATIKEEAKSARGPGKAGWVGIIAAIGAALSSLAKAIFFSRVH